MFTTKASFEALVHRRFAELHGLHLYDGDPCCHCGRIRRYVNNSCCVSCTALRNRINKILARAFGRQVVYNVPT